MPRGQYARCLAVPCKRKVLTSELCKKHYMRWYRLEDKSDNVIDDLERISSLKPKSQYKRRGKVPVAIGSTKMTDKGFVLIKVEDAPHSTAKDGSGWVLLHRLVMQKELGRPLKRNERVVHINGNKTDNHPANLRIVVDG
jgi:hypothetical protein